MNMANVKISVRKHANNIRERIIRKLGGYVTIQEQCTETRFGCTTIFPAKVRAGVILPSRATDEQAKDILAQKIAASLAEGDYIRITRERDQQRVDCDVISGETMVYKPVNDETINAY